MTQCCLTMNQGFLTMNQGFLTMNQGFFLNNVENNEPGLLNNVKNNDAVLHNSEPGFPSWWIFVCPPPPREPVGDSSQPALHLRLLQHQHGLRLAGARVLCTCCASPVEA